MSYCNRLTPEIKHKLVKNRKYLEPWCWTAMEITEDRSSQLVCLTLNADPQRQLIAAGGKRAPPGSGQAGHGQASSLFSMQFLVRTNKKHTKKRP